MSGVSVCFSSPARMPAMEATGFEAPAFYDLHERRNRSWPVSSCVGHAFGGVAAVAGFEAVAGHGIDAFPGANGVRDGETDHDGAGGDDQRVSERFQADAAEFADVANPGDPDDE